MAGVGLICPGDGEQDEGEDAQKDSAVREIDMRDFYDLPDEPAGDEDIRNGCDRESSRTIFTAISAMTHAKPTECIGRTVYKQRRRIAAPDGSIIEHDILVVAAKLWSACPESADADWEIDCVAGLVIAHRIFF